MSTEITKEEIIAYTEAQNKTAVALEKIVDRLSDLTVNQGKILEKLNNGMGSDIKNILTGCGSCQTDMKTVKDDVKFMKNFWGILSACIGVALIVTEIIHKVIHP